MTGFSTQSLLVSSKDGRNFLLQEAFSFTSKSGRVYTVPVGSESDGASTPMALWGSVVPHIPPFGWYWKAAFLHDWAYRYSDLSKDDCDNLLYEAMEWLIENESHEGIYGWVEKEDEEAKAKIIYEGVHVGGESSFDEDRRNQRVIK